MTRPSSAQRLRFELPADYLLSRIGQRRGLLVASRPHVDDEDPA
jgi:hypothetical protein